MTDTTAAPPSVDAPGGGQLFIGGRWTNAATTEVLDIEDPATEQIIATVAAASPADVDRAVDAARAAFEAGTWRRRPAAERADVLEELGARLQKRARAIGDLTTYEFGMPRSQAEFLVGLVVNEIASFVQVLRAEGESDVRRRIDGGMSLVTKEPSGVVAAITASNGAFAQSSWKLIPALAAGCSVILKPAAETPLSSLLVAEVVADLVHEGRLEPGLVSVLPAGPDVSAYLVSHPGIDHITFTGSTRVGSTIMRAASERLARVTLELGGKSAAVVLDDADMPTVLETLVPGGCGSTGQMCIALSRVLVPRHLEEELVEGYIAGMDAMTVGDPWDPATVLGPLVSGAQRDRVEGHVRHALDEGAALRRGGQRPEGLKRGWFYEPTLFTGVENRMAIAQEEVFGPVIAVIPYDDVDEAVTIANDSPYGLAGSVYSADPERALTVATRIRAGTVSVNFAGMDLTLPFGGFKRSGIGREGGPEGLDEFRETRVVNLGH